MDGEVLVFKNLKYKDVKNIYKIDEYGNIYSEYKKDFLKPKKDKDGYLQLILAGKNRKIYVRVATLVAYNFIGEPPKEIKDPTIDHIDNNILNNYYRNLRWLERSENTRRATKKSQLGEKNNQSVLNEKQVIEICKKLIENKLTLQEIANIFKVHKTTISNIRRKKNWKNICNNFEFPEIKIERNKEGRYCKKK